MIIILFQKWSLPVTWQLWTLKEIQVATVVAMEILRRFLTLSENDKQEWMILTL